MQNVFDRNDSRMIMQYAHKLARLIKSGATEDVTYAAALQQALKRVHAVFKNAVTITKIAINWCTTVKGNFLLGNEDTYNLDLNIELSDTVRIKTFINKGFKGNDAHIEVRIKNNKGEWLISNLSGTVWAGHDAANTNHWLGKIAARFNLARVMRELLA